MTESKKIKHTHKMNRKEKEKAGQGKRERQNRHAYDKTTAKWPGQETEQQKPQP